jgi:hypothetical protein
MRSKNLLLATALAVLPAGMAFAQPATTQTPGSENKTAQAAPSGAMPAEPATPADPAAPAAPSANAPSDAAPTAAATQADLKTGATVYDSAGAQVGKIQAVTANGAVVASGKLRAEVPTASFAKNSRGLVIGITKAEFEAAVTKAKS